MKEVTVITKCNSYDEHFDEYPNFLGVYLSENRIKRINAYRKALETMKSDGLTPYSIKEFDDGCYFLDVFERQDKFSNEPIAFISSDVESEWNDAFDNDSEDVVTLDNIDSESDFRVEVMTLNVTTSGVYFRGIVKHCDINFESDVIFWEDFDKIVGE